MKPSETYGQLNRFSNFSSQYLYRSMHKKFSFHLISFFLSEQTTRFLKWHFLKQSKISYDRQICSQFCYAHRYVRHILLIPSDQPNCWLNVIIYTTQSRE